MFRADPQAIGPEDLSDFRDRSGGFESEIAHDDISFVDQDARPFLELRQVDARIDIAIIIGAADDDVRGVPRGIAEESADAVRGRSDFLDHFLELLDHLPRFADRLFLRGNLRANEKQFPAIPIVRGDGSEDEIEGFEQTSCALARSDRPDFRIRCCARRSSPASTSAAICSQEKSLEGVELPRDPFSCS